jgi:hypothetical protein
MRKIVRAAAAVLAMLVFMQSLSTVHVKAATVVDFDELSLAPNSYYNGYGQGADSGGWTSRGVEFNTGEFGPGWSYSNVNDTTTAGFMNQFAAITGTGFGGSGNYAIANSFGPNAAYMNLPDRMRATSIQVSNTTYAALAMRDGYFGAKAFGGETGLDPDFFKVTLSGFEQWDATGAVTGTAEFFLSDFRAPGTSDDYIVDTWQLMNLTQLGNARSIGVTLESSDNDEVFGMNTPAYVAFDQLTLTAVPEPATIGFLACSSVAVVTLARRKKIASKQQRT